MLNGYSGFFPADHARLRQALADFPSPPGVGLLQAMGVQCVVVHHRLPGAPARPEIDPNWPLTYQDNATGANIYCKK